MTMNQKTLFLTGYHRKRYANLLEPLKQLRIADMRILLNELREESKKMHWNSEEYRENTTRYKEVEKAIEWWKEI